MVSVDVQSLRRLAPRERIEQVQVLRELVERELEQAEAAAKNSKELLDTIEKDANREAETLERVAVPQSQKINVGRLFRRKRLEETVRESPETQNAQSVQRAQSKNADYSVRELLKVAYTISEGTLERLASLRNKIATGERLPSEDYRVVERYDELARSFERILPYIDDDETRELVTQTQKAVHEIEKYKTRKLVGEPERRKEEF